jgi:hypothetical protein
MQRKNDVRSKVQRPSHWLTGCAQQVFEALQQVFEALLMLLGFPDCYC